MLPTLRRMSEQTQIPPTPRAADSEGLQWSVPKSDRLETTDRAMVTRYIVQESLRQRRGTREYIHNKPYARIVARLAAVPPEAAATVPPLNPIRLYGNPTPIGQAPDGEQAGGSGDGGKAVSYRVVELLGSILPPEDGQELDQQEVAELVDRARRTEGDELTMRPAFAPDGELAREPSAGARLGRPEAADEPLPANTTVLAKSASDAEDDDDGATRTIRQIGVRRGDTLSRILQAAGADAQLARSMVEAARGILQDRDLVPGYEIELVLEPALDSADQLEPVQFSVRDQTGTHRLTVARNSAGELVASATPITGPGSRPAAGSTMSSSSVYSSLYHAARSQGVPHEMIMEMLKVHAVDTDFRRRARGTDELELFFDIKEDGRNTHDNLGELLYSSITVGGQANRYFRFRSSNGVVDFYDENGNNSRKFLILKPIRGDEARLTSGYGLRYHPLLNTRKMHTGVDWAAPIGTPILAAGNGVIEEAGPKGQYGNYIRIRHANGYQSTYAHMSRFASGVREGARVRQGQVIGAVGNTGFSTGPHLHYEILVNNRFVDPLSIQVPREKRLQGRDLAEFHKERARVEDLLRRRPVKVEQTPSTQ